jgi:perosamine synthetase
VATSPIATISERPASVAGRDLLDPEGVVARVRAVLPPGTARAALHEPSFTGSEREYLADCIETGWVSYGGAYVGKFEAALAQACGVDQAIALTSGTVALQVALTVGGVNADEEVLMPSLTFVASANAVSHAGAVPHFVDVDEATLGIDPAALRIHLQGAAERRNDGLYNTNTGRKISALMPVHIFGHPADMDGLSAIAREYDLLLFEDATEALGSRYKGKPCGSLARVAALSFNGNKVVTTGGGGAVLTNDAALGQRVRHLTTTAKKPHRWAFDHDEIAWNFRLPNVNAALGLAQMERLGAALSAKRQLWQRYAEVFADMEGARIFSDAGFAESNHWLVALLLDRGNEAMLEPILTATNDAGLMTRPAWIPMHRLRMYSGSPRAALPTTESLAQRIINLPSSPFLAPT